MSAASEDLRQLWQRQALDAPRINLAYLRHRTAALQRRTMLRNGLEYVSGLAGMACVVWFQWNFIAARPIFSAGIALWILGVIYIMAQWHRRAGAQAPAVEIGTLDALQFYRQQLERQRDARHRNWRWWLPPVVPCVVVLFVALFVEIQPIPWPTIAALAVWVVVGIPLGILGYERSAKGFQREIDALDSMTAKT